MNTVREATLKDLEDLVVLCKKSFEWSGDDCYPFDDEIAKEQCKAIIEDPRGFLIVLDTDEGVQGMFSAHIFMGLFGRGLITHEGFFYIDEKYRGSSAARKFMKAYNKWGEDNGAVIQVMVSHEDHEKFTKFYSLFDYTPSERTYIRKI